MDITIKKFFKPGIVHFMAFPETANGNTDIDFTIKKIVCDDYFDVIEITSINDYSTRSRVKNLILASGIEVLFGAQPVLLRNKLNINDRDEKLRQKSIQILKDCIDQAYEIGAKGISFLSGQYEENFKENAFELLVDSTETICNYAKEKGSMMVELEVFDFDVDKKSLIGPTALAKKFAERIRKKFDNFGLLVDLSHIPLLRESPVQAVIPVKDYITHIHIGNCSISDRNSPIYGDYHPPFGYPGTEIGVQELADFIQLLMDIGFFNSERKIPVSFEVKPVPGQDPDIVIAGSKRTLNQAWLSVK